MKKIVKFRPSARLIRTIGDNLIKDPYAAIVELVKNAYDADASFIEINFLNMNSKDNELIIIKDNGHGMTTKELVEKWMVPSTLSKVVERKSPGNRTMQGRKGIGRFAASILGQELILKTTDKKGTLTSIRVDWSAFDNNKFLDEINLNMEISNSDSETGTEMRISSCELSWDDSDYAELLKELRKLIFPFRNKKDVFDIFIKFKNTGVKLFNNERIKIEPFPIIDMFDYRLHGTISPDGEVDFEFENKSEKNIPSDKSKLQLKTKRGIFCGKVKFDFRVFDRDPEAIDDLIQRGLNIPGTEEPLKKREARKLLNEHCGASIYRGDFRIRPYGEAGYDWLELDKLRVQNPSLKIGADQIIGIINIESEEKSGLIEKSARDGLRENDAYNSLKQMLSSCLKELEIRRFEFRKKTGRGRKSVKIEQELESLFDFTNLKNQVDLQLRKSNVSSKIVEKIEDVIVKVEKSKAKSLENIKETIAMYQGQVTVGKIIIVLMHEGRKPLKYLREQSPRIAEWISSLQKNASRDLIKKIISRLDDTKSESELLIELFDKLDPLAVKKRGARKDFKVGKIIRRAADLFSSELKLKKISVNISQAEELVFKGWEQDLYITLTNLFDNSIYWVSQASKKRIIDIFAERDGDCILIHFKDSGPGIEMKNIESNMIFEPGFSTKPEGTGLGLAISGEAIERNNGKLKAIYSKNGAYFRIELRDCDE